MAMFTVRTGITTDCSAECRVQSDEREAKPSTLIKK
jgi:hypothetical protein